MASARMISARATPSTLDYSGDTRVDWFSSDASACTAFGAWSGDVGTWGSQVLDNLVKDNELIAFY